MRVNRKYWLISIGAGLGAGLLGTFTVLLERYFDSNVWRHCHINALHLKDICDIISG